MSEGTQPQTQDATVTIHFKDLRADEEIRDILEQRCRHISSEFPETSHYELHLSQDALVFSASAHVSGKHIDLAAHAEATSVRTAGERALDKLERELRRTHDKRIFGQRRSAQQQATRKRG